MAPRNRQTAYEQYFGKQLPTMLFLDEINFDTVLAALRQRSDVTSVNTLSEPDGMWVGLIEDIILKRPSKYLENTLSKDKYYMRAVLAGIVPQPEFLALVDIASALAFVQAHAKVILKPRRDDSASGVQVLDVNMQSLAAIQTQLTTILASSPDGYMLETFNPYPHMCTVDGYAIDGQITRFIVHEYVTPILASLQAKQALVTRTAHFYSRNDTSMLAKIFTLTQTIISTLNSCDKVMPFHLELFYDDSGNLAFCELGKRFGGGGILELIVAETGVDIAQEYWLRQNGDVISDEGPVQLQPTQIVAWYKKFAQAGYLTTMPTSYLPSLPWVSAFYPMVQVDTQTQASQSITDLLFKLRFTAADEATFSQHLNDIDEYAQQYRWI
ncbi:ATP-grasp domain-containing protein [Periweissella ghanensis]|uniref:ATP-grasp domain-containing protein n=1 Tax=Periweissella ghanensis TaxID=467997 RepID=A0ABN8BK36_9LACO|nr:hypothetical protein [Periweissella ghanensis]MCM0600482.1 hypothetical protein [Periweissella ghanensis]CAH0418052.1 hypothetical protein WGH24286_00468 [Periweissella ghanensis]